MKSIGRGQFAADRSIEPWLAAVARCATLGALVGLAGCASLRHSTLSPPAEPPAAAVESTPTPAPAPPSTMDLPAESATRTTDNAPAPCACAELKAKPRPKRKPRPVVAKESPPQLPTAPIVADTPKGGIIQAQVKPMSVSVMSILGKRVRGPNGEDLGRVVDVLADATGRVRIAIIDFGGFLGVGNHRIAVDWPLLRFVPDEREPSLLLSLSRDQLGRAPEYKETARPQTLMEPVNSTDPAAQRAASPSTPPAVSPSTPPAASPPTPSGASPPTPSGASPPTPPAASPSTAPAAAPRAQSQ